jgi:hypothetical protein
MRHVAYALFLGLGLWTAVFATEFTPEQQAAWQMEEIYWKDVQAGDVKSYLTPKAERVFGEVAVVQY